MGPLVGRAVAAGASALAKRAAKKAAEKAAKEADDIANLPRSGSKGSALGEGAKHNSEPRMGRGYRDFETTSPRLSDETIAPYKKGGSVGSASKRADGIAQRGKTKGRMI